MNPMEILKEIGVKMMGKNYEELWTEFKQWIVKYNEDHIQTHKIDGKEAEFGRYEVALSCNDLIEKMDEMESRK